MTPEQVATKFYDAFAKRDGATMASCYASDASFSDPVFPSLRGAQIGIMWKALCSRSKDIKITYSILSHDSQSAKVRWDAYYTFTGTGRAIHNRIVAHLTVQNGKITRHVDSFSFWRWSRQALGLTGWLLGWTPIVKNKVRRTAAKLISPVA